MSAPLQQSTRSSFVQQFIQFPRQSVPRTLVYGAVINLAFYYLASQLSRVIEKRLQLHSITSYENKAVVKVVVFGGLTALFNLVQFKLFNYQLGRVASLAIRVVITAAMTFTYYMLNRKSPNSEFPLSTDRSHGTSVGFISRSDSLLTPMPEVHFIANPEDHQDFLNLGFSSIDLNNLYSTIFTLDRSRKYDVSYISTILEILRLSLANVDKSYPSLKIDYSNLKSAFIRAIIQKLKLADTICENMNEALTAYRNTLLGISSSLESLREAIKL